MMIPTFEALSRRRGLSKLGGGGGKQQPIESHSYSSNDILPPLSCLTETENFLSKAQAKPSQYLVSLESKRLRHLHHALVMSQPKALDYF